MRNRWSLACRLLLVENSTACVSCPNVLLKNDYRFPRNLAGRGGNSQRSLRSLSAALERTVAIYVSPYSPLAALLYRRHVTQPWQSGPIDRAGGQDRRVALARVSRTSHYDDA